MIGQVAIEYVMVIGIVLVLTLPILAIFLSEYNQILGHMNRQNSANWIIELDSDIKNIKYQGDGSYMIKRYNYPVELNSITVKHIGSNSILIFNISNYGNIAFIYPFRVDITSGRLVGNIILNISNMGGNITISVV